MHSRRLVSHRDLATVSEDGYYTLSGRKSDLIISGGFNIYPREIEEFLEEHPPSRRLPWSAGPMRPREVPVAYLVCQAPIDLLALERHCRKNCVVQDTQAIHCGGKTSAQRDGKIQKHCWRVNQPSHSSPRATAVLFDHQNRYGTVDITLNFAVPRVFFKWIKLCMT